MKQCINYGVNISAEKSYLCQEQVDFLGFEINKFGIKPSKKHVEKIRDFPRPKTRKQLKSFLGLCQFNGRLVPDTSVLLKNLYRLTSSKNAFIWTDEHEEQFKRYKERLSATPGLCHRNINYDLYLTSDASGHAWGACLYQLNPSNNQFEPLGYASGVFSEPDKRVSIRHRELLSFIYAVRNFEYWLLGASFYSIIDHHSLVFLMNEKSRKKLNLKILNGINYLHNFTFKIIHKNGSDPIMATADALSRSLTLEEAEKMVPTPDIIPDRIFYLTHTNSACDNIMAINLRRFARGSSNEENFFEKQSKFVLSIGERKISHSEFIKMQSSDSYINNLKNKLKVNAKSTVNKFYKENGIIYAKGEPKRLVIPKFLIREIINFVHVLYQHPGRLRTHYILKHFFITGIGKHIEQCSNSCITCLEVKPAKSPITEQNKLRNFADRPSSRIYVDLWDAGRSDCNSKRYLLGMCCELTGFLDGEPLTNKTEKNVSKAVIKLILRHGCLNATFITDNGKEFQNLFRNVIKILGHNHIFTSAYFSKSNGKIERKFRELNTKLKLLHSNVRQWSLYWPFFQFIHNNSPVDNLNGLSSFEALYCRMALDPFITPGPKAKIDIKGFDKYSEALTDFLENLHPKLATEMQERHKNIINIIINTHAC